MKYAHWLLTVQDICQQVYGQDIEDMADDPPLYHWWKTGAHPTQAVNLLRRLDR